MCEETITFKRHVPESVLRDAFVHRHRDQPPSAEAQRIADLEARRVVQDWLRRQREKGNESA